MVHIISQNTSRRQEQNREGPSEGFEQSERRAAGDSNCKERQPERHTLSRKAPWRCARTMATQTGMTNQWLKDQGLVSVKELWVNIHYPAKAR
jgi:hypothetical protein